MTRQSLAFLLFGLIAGVALGVIAGHERVEPVVASSLDTSHLDEATARIDDAAGRLAAAATTRQADSLPVRQEAVPPPSLSAECLTRLEARLAAIESSIEHLAEVVSTDTPTDQVGIPTRRDAVESMAARYSVEGRSHDVLAEHFRWSKRQVHQTYGTPDSVREGGKEWLYRLPGASGGRQMNLVFVFDGLFVTGMWAGSYQ